jgi:hypothetical protein
MVALAGIGGVLFARWLSSKSPRATSTAENSLVVAEDDLDLGRCYQTRSARHRFRITNRSTNTITLTRFDTSCECLRISPESDVVLQPSETKAFEVDLTLVSRAQAATLSEEARRVSAGVRYTVTAGGEEHRTSWEFRCVLVPTIRCEPAIVRLGTLSARLPGIERIVRIKATEEVASVETEDNSAVWTVAIEREAPDSLPQSFRATLRAKEQRPRLVSDRIRFRPVRRDGTRLPPIEVRIEGEVVEDVVAQPREIHFGRQAFEAMLEEAIQLHSLTDKSFRVTGYRTTVHALQVVPLAGGADSYAVKIRGVTLGVHQEVVEFTIADDTGRSFVLPVPVKYVGIDKAPPEVEPVNGGNAECR